MWLMAFYEQHKEHFILSLFTVFAIRVLLFLLEAAAIYFFARKKEIKNAWISFVPIVFPFTLGKIAESEEKKYSKSLLILSILKSVLFCITAALTVNSVKTIFDFAIECIEKNVMMTGDMFVSFIPVIIFFVITLIVAVIFTIYYFMALYKIFKDHTKRFAPLLLVGSLVSTIVKSVAIFVFALKSQKEDID